MSLLCIICNKTLPSPLPKYCRFPVDENERNILLLGLFRAENITENRVKTLKTVANASTGLCHSHVSKAALSYLPSFHVSINYSDPCGELKRLLGEEESRKEDHLFHGLFQYWNGGFSAKLARIGTQLQLEVPSFRTVFSFLESAVNCGCEDGLAFNCQQVSNQVKKRVRDKSEDVTGTMISNEASGIKKARNVDSSTATGISGTTSFTCEINESDSTRRHISIKNLTASDVEALAQLMISRGLQVENSYLSNGNALATVANVSSSSLGVNQPGSSGIGFGSGNPTGSGSMVTPTTDPKKSLQPTSSAPNTLPTVSTVSNIQKIRPPLVPIPVPATSVPSVNPVVPSPNVPTASGSNLVVAGGSGIAQPRDLSNWDIKLTAKETTDLCGMNVVLKSIDECSLPQRLEQMDRILVDAYRFDISHMDHIVFRKEDTSSSTSAGMTFDFWTRAANFVVKPSWTKPSTILKEFCHHLVECVPDNLRHICSFAQEKHTKRLLRFPDSVHRQFDTLLWTCFGLPWYCSEYLYLRWAIEGTARKIMDYIFMTSRKHYNFAKRKDFPEIRMGNRLVSPCQFAVAAYRKKIGLPYMKELEPYFDKV